eukprot:TRINITY_DN1852_c3_g1_i1.p1 TRINITY_DN1852_c3_g1~~TRINITY_DN1852_c3_g1_i1.p1  ORF type:complete len:588 (-),score=79.60 TRINITY_DN1852_c3_g1_i1:232-1995(-)
MTSKDIKSYLQNARTKLVHLIIATRNGTHLDPSNSNSFNLTLPKVTLSTQHAAILPQIETTLHLRIHFFNQRTQCRVLLEDWVFECTRNVQKTQDITVGEAYIRLIVLIRAVYCYAISLPAYSLSKFVNNSKDTSLEATITEGGVNLSPTNDKLVKRMTFSALIDTYRFSLNVNSLPTLSHLIKPTNISDLVAEDFLNSSVTETTTNDPFQTRSNPIFIKQNDKRDTPVDNMRSKSVKLKYNDITDVAYTPRTILSAEKGRLNIEAAPPSNSYAKNIVVNSFGTDNISHSSSKSDISELSPVPGDSPLNKGRAAQSHDYDEDDDEDRFQLQTPPSSSFNYKPTPTSFNRTPNVHHRVSDSSLSRSGSLGKTSEIRLGMSPFRSSPTSQSLSNRPGSYEQPAPIENITKMSPTGTRNLYDEDITDNWVDIPPAEMKRATQTLNLEHGLSPSSPKTSPRGEKRPEKRRSNEEAIMKQKLRQLSDVAQRHVQPKIKRTSGSMQDILARIPSEPSSPRGLKHQQSTQGDHTVPYRTKSDEDRRSTTTTSFQPRKSSFPEHLMLNLPDDTFKYFNMKVPMDQFVMSFDSLSK